MARDMSSELDTLREAAQTHRQATAARDKAIRRAAKHLSLRAIAGAVDLSHQRVHQIVKGS